jgi:hypothetical protein
MRRRKQNTAKQKQLQREWEEMLSKHSKPLECGAKARNISPKKIVEAKPQVEVIKPSTDLKKMMGIAVKKEPKVYTGDKMLGITVLHKSCLQPVFNEQSAKDAASMRR